MSTDRPRPGWTAALLASLWLTACDVRLPAPPPSAATPAPNSAATDGSAPAAPISPRMARGVFGSPHFRGAMANDSGNAAELADLEPGSRLRAEIRPGHTLLRLPLYVGEAVWGLGSGVEGYNRRGQKLSVGGADGAGRPWLASSRGYGVFVNTTLPIRVDVGASDTSEIRIDIPDDGAEVWMCTGSPTDLVAQLTDWIGRPDPLPDRFFHPWLAQSSHVSAHAMDRVIEQAEKNGLKFGPMALNGAMLRAPGQPLDTNRFPRATAWARKHLQRGVQLGHWTAARSGVGFCLLTGTNVWLTGAWPAALNASWDDLTHVVRSGLSASWSGEYLWNNPVGGFRGTPEKELYLRWLQLGVFSPLLQFHGETAREPWQYDRETLDLARGYLRVREQLRPYLHEAARDARERGHPLWRPLAWAFPDDAAARAVEDQFLFGPDLMIAPILSTNHARAVYLPGGRWLDLWDSTWRQGPTQLMARADLSQIPVYARAEASARWNNLLRAVPHRPPSPLALELAGPRDQRGLTPDTRFLHPGRGEMIAYTLQNNSPVSIEGVMTPKLPTGFRSEPTHRSFTLAPGAGQEISFHIVPPPNLLAGSYEVVGQCRVGSLTAKTPKIHLVQSPDWRMMGPFPGGVGSAQPLDGRTVDINARHRTARGVDLLWQKLPESARRSDGLIDYGWLAGPETGITCYVYASLPTPVGRRVRLLAGSGDAMTVWVNGQSVLHRPVFREPARDEDRTDILLRGGVNTILLRLSRDTGTPAFYLRLADPER